MWLAEQYERSIIDPMNESRMAFVEAAKDAAVADDDGSVVYYVRIGDHVKIGHTTRLSQRMSSLYVDERQVLATEPGGRQLEKARHLQFAAERVYSNRELFNPSPRLLAHIEALKVSA